LEIRTTHSAKGREWDHDFVVGAIEVFLPRYRATSKSAPEFLELVRKYDGLSVFAQSAFDKSRNL
jgi:superfamily I DNA/RNA helicase